jgi:hypothetical protein
MSNFEIFPKGMKLYKVTLAAGTVTIVDPTISASSVVLLTRTAVGLVAVTGDTVDYTAVCAAGQVVINAVSNNGAVVATNVNSLNVLVAY